MCARKFIPNRVVAPKGTIKSQQKLKQFSIHQLGLKWFQYYDPSACTIWVLQRPAGVLTAGLHTCGLTPSKACAWLLMSSWLLAEETGLHSSSTAFPYRGSLWHGTEWLFLCLMVCEAQHHANLLHHFAISQIRVYQWAKWEGELSLISLLVIAQMITLSVTPKRIMKYISQSLSMVWSR